MITIALAAYNVEEYIEECILSILNQTYQDFEFLCINDGSTDRTIEILRKYEQLDNRIRIINNTENEGLAVARNISLNEAKGEYIWMIDGDDLYDLTLLDKAYHKIIDEESDVVLWDYEIFYNSNDFNKISKKSRLINLENYDRVSLLKTPAFTWVKLFKIKTLKDLGYQFPIGFTRQDIPLHWLICTSNIKISIIPEKLSFYRQQPNATTAQKNEKLFHLAYIMDIVKNDLESRNLLGQYSAQFYSQQLNLLFGMYDSVHPDLKSKALELIKERVSINQIKLIKNNLPIRKQAKWFYLGQYGNTFAKLKFSIWKYIRSLYRKMKI